MILLFRVFIQFLFYALVSAHAEPPVQQTDMSSQLPVHSPSMPWRKSETFADQNRSKVQGFVDSLMADDSHAATSSEDGATETQR